MHPKNISKKRYVFSFVPFLIAVFLALPALGQGVLYVENDHVGIGIANPTAPLHLYKNDTGDLVFTVQNAGNPTTALYNFAVNSAGAFTVNKSGTGGQEFTVRERNDAMGSTLFVQGSVEGTQFVQSSSREFKTDFSALDTRKILDRLVNLPVSSWRYKHEQSAVRHFGPVAEDFKDAFDLGDGKHISTVDAAGVAMAAIQGLHEVLQEKDVEMQSLRERLQEKDTELERLEKRIHDVESLLMSLTESRTAQKK